MKYPHFPLSILLLAAFLFLLSSCTPAQPADLVVMTHDSFAMSEAVVNAFEAATGAKVIFLPSGDAGLMLNKAILAKNAPLADVIFGVDNAFLSRALDEDILEAYASPELQNIPAAFKLDSSNRAVPVDYGDVCINYDKAYFVENNLAVPQNLEDLTKPEYRALLAVENPATSSVGLAFLFATVAHYGNSFADYWQALKDNDAVVVDGWETAYYVNFSASSGRGPQPLVVSYASSPAAEAIYAETPLDTSPTASILGPNACFRQIEFVGILKGTKNRALAEKFIDFMLGKQFQEDLPLQMFVYPINSDAALPEAFVRYAQTPTQPATLSPADIAAHRDEWIQAWINVMLK
ncbi:MAG: thiamine ABC transporter substrate-binding protein [Anaerolineales bacterium]|nr:thiamine ABC transporter substrate-binding protein [Anaerolineales bacterium]